MKPSSKMMKELISFVICVIGFILVLVVTAVILFNLEVSNILFYRTVLVAVLLFYAIIVLFMDIFFPSITSIFLRYEYKGDHRAVVVLLNNIIRFYLPAIVLDLQVENKLYYVSFLLGALYIFNYVYAFVSKDNNTFAHKIFKIEMVAKQNTSNTPPTESCGLKKPLPA